MKQRRSRCFPSGRVVIEHDPSQTLQWGAITSSHAHTRRRTDLQRPLAARRGGRCGPPSREAGPSPACSSPLRAVASGRRRPAGRMSSPASVSQAPPASAPPAAAAHPCWCWCLAAEQWISTPWCPACNCGSHKRLGKLLIVRFLSNFNWILYTVTLCIKGEELLKI